MATAILFLVGAFVIVAFIIAKIVDPSSEIRKSREEMLDSVDAEKEFDAGSLFLKIGPILAGIGLFGYLASEWWDKAETRLLLMIVVVLITTIGGIWLRFRGKDRSLKVLAEGLLIIGSFSYGALLYAVNDVIEENNGSELLGITEIIGIWFILTILISYLAKSTWLLAVATALNIFWNALYLNDSFDFADFFGVGLDKINSSDYSLMILPAVTTIGLILVYAWHQKNNHQKADSGFRPYQYLTGLMAFFGFGALIFRGIDQNHEFFQDSSKAIIGDTGIAISALILFAIDFILKRYKSYSVHYLSAVGLAVATIVSIVFLQEDKLFFGFYFLEVAYMVWLLADFVRNNSQLSQVLFYGLNGIQLYVIAVNGSNYNWFKLIVLLGILIYTAIIHYMRRGLVLYVMTAGVLSLSIKLLSSNAGGFLTVFVLGLILSSFGVFYTQTRSKLIEKQNLARKENSKFDQ